MDTVKFREFQARARALGFRDVVERDWKPLTVRATHAHPFAVKALVVRGEMRLTVAESTRHLTDALACCVASIPYTSSLPRRPAHPCADSTPRAHIIPSDGSRS